MVDKVRLIIASAAFAVFIMLAVIFFIVSFPVGAGICIALGCLYLFFAIKYMRYVRMDDNGAAMLLFGKVLLSFSWDQIRETGICGTRVFHAAGSRFTGARYIYLSREEMNEDSRFNMCLKWPPEDKIYVRYNEKLKKQLIRLCEVHMDSEVVLYNTGNQPVRTFFQIFPGERAAVLSKGYMHLAA